MAQQGKSLRKGTYAHMKLTDVEGIELDFSYSPPRPVIAEAQNADTLDGYHADSSGDADTIPVIDSGADMFVKGNIQAGYGSGGIAMTNNDGYGNANLTFNHTNGTPEQDGVSARIVVNTDSGSTGSMTFQIADYVNEGVPISLTTMLEIYDYGVYSQGNKIWHEGNDGPGSGLDADTLDTYESSATSVASTVVVRDSNSHINCNAVASDWPTSNITPTKVYCSYDKYMRSMTLTDFQARLLLVDADKLDGLHGSSYLRSDATDTGTDLTLSTQLRTDRIRSNSGQQVEILAGETHAYATGNTNEFVYVAAEGGLLVYSSPDNWVSGWAGRYTTAICNTSGHSSFPRYVFANYYNTSMGNFSGTTPTKVFCGYDNYIRSMTMTNFSYEVLKDYGDNQSTCNFGSTATTNSYLRAANAYVRTLSGQILMSNATVQIRLLSNRWEPSVNNNTYLGSSSYKYVAVYAVNGTIQTSDERFKDFTRCVDYSFIYDLEPITYTWKDTMEEGDTATKYGFSAQQVLKVMPDKKAKLIDQENPDQLGLVSTELIAPMVACIQDLKSEIDLLKKELKELKSGRV